MLIYLLTIIVVFIVNTLILVKEKEYSKVALVFVFIASLFWPITLLALIVAVASALLGTLGAKSGS